MQTISDDNLSLASRPYAAAGVNRVAIAVMGAFTFAEDAREVTYLPEAEIWGLAAPILANGMSLDEGFPKPGKELLVSGSAFAPPGKQVKAVDAAIRAADIERTLHVAGNRIWEKGGMGGRTCSHPCLSTGSTLWAAKTIRAIR